MALINCSECKKEISDTAEQCIQCGAPIVKAKILKKIEPPFKVKGNEKLHYMFGTAGVKLFAFGPIAFLGATAIGEKGSFGNLAIVIILALFWIPIVNGIGSFFSISTRQRNKKMLNLYEFFKVNIPILSEFKPNYQNLGVSTHNKSSYDDAMFQIYLDAYMKGADAIVLNHSTSNTFTTRINTGGIVGRQGDVSTGTNNNISATLLKY